jgi:hypothetical protein
MKQGPEFNRACRVTKGSLSLLPNRQMDQAAESQFRIRRSFFLPVGSKR